MHPLKVGMLRRLFAAGGGAEGVQFVFVNACYSEGAGEAFVRAGVPHVVAVRWDARVSDKMCRLFTRSFYLALLVGRTIQQSFDIAEASVDASPDVGAYDSYFVLLPQGGNHHVSVFGSAAQGQFKDETPALPPSTCDAVPTSLVWRQQYTQVCVRAPICAVTWH